jgi:hypothetical protein
MAAADSTQPICPPPPPAPILLPILQQEIQSTSSNDVVEGRRQLTPLKQIEVKRG